MSAQAIEALPTAHRSAVQRVGDVVRIEALLGKNMIGLPMGVLAGVFLIVWVVFASIGGAAPPAARASGALMSIYFTMAGAHIQTITQLFPFALGISVTRRAFSVGTAMVVSAQALFFGLVLTLLGLLERVTGGWGIGLQHFDLAFLRQDNAIAQWFVYASPFLAFTSVFVLAAVIFKRWGPTGLYTAALTGGALLAGAAVVITWQQWWGNVLQLVTGTPGVVFWGVYPLVLAAVAGTVGYLLLRRATP